MANGVTVTPGSGFTGATAVLNATPSDVAGFVTFTTSATIPASPYKIFTITWAGSWASTYPNPQGVRIDPYPLYTNNRTQAQVAAAAALGPFYALPNSINTTVDVYCTNAPATGTAYDLFYSATQGP